MDAQRFGKNARHRLTQALLSLWPQLCEGRRRLFKGVAFLTSGMVIKPFSSSTKDLGNLLYYCPFCLGKFYWIIKWLVMKPCTLKCSHKMPWLLPLLVLKDHLAAQLNPVLFCQELCLDKKQGKWPLILVQYSAILCTVEEWPSSAFTRETATMRGNGCLFSVTYMFFLCFFFFFFC